jgi:hypothetical protein
MKKSRLKRRSNRYPGRPPLSLGEKISFDNIAELMSTVKKESAKLLKHNAPWYELISDQLDNWKCLCAQMSEKAGESFSEELWIAVEDLWDILDRYGLFGNEELSVVTGKTKLSTDSGIVETQISTPLPDTGSRSEQVLERFDSLAPVLLELRLPLSSICSCRIPSHPRFKKMAVALAKARERDAKALAAAKRREAEAANDGGPKARNHWNVGYCVETEVQVGMPRNSWEHLDGSAVIEKLKWWLDQKRQYETENFRVRPEVR